MLLNVDMVVLPAADAERLNDQLIRLDSMLSVSGGVTVRQTLDTIRELRVGLQSAAQPLRFALEVTVQGRLLGDS